MKKQSHLSSLPAFSLEDYETLVSALANHSYEFRLFADFSSTSGNKTVYLRHDIDLHLHRIEELARLEASLKVPATYYISLTQHYNPLSHPNRTLLRHLIDLGHEIGLHYDLSLYPPSQEEANKHLAHEIHILEHLVGRKVRTISMHQPFQGIPDPFLSSPAYLNPQNPAVLRHMVYVSDSCRAWRDDSLLSCFGENPPSRIMVNTHPELWLNGCISRRMEYLHMELYPNAIAQQREYFLTIVQDIWKSHPAPQLHDQRERSKAEP